MEKQLPIRLSALLLGTLLAATGCDKATIAPERPLTGTQDAAPVRERGIEIRVTGIYEPTGQPFTGTLRVTGFRSDGPGTIYTMGIFQQVGGGLSRENVATLESTPVAFFTTYPDNDAYCYSNAWQTQTSYFRFGLSRREYANPYSLVNLDSYYTITLNEDTPKYNRIAGTIGSIVNLWNPVTVNANGLPTRGLGGLTGAGVTQLALYLDGIAAVVGRY
jgi:hypothetical protein